MDDLNDSFAALRDAVLEIPTGDPEDPAVRNAANYFQSLVASEYLVEVEPGKYKYTSAGIAQIITRLESCAGPPRDATFLNAKAPPRKH